MTTKTPIEHLREQLETERTRANRHQLRAELAEHHLRDLRRGVEAMLDDVGTDPEWTGRLRLLLKSRKPAACAVKMSHYGTCSLGTYGCLGRHPDIPAPQVSGRLTLPVTGSPEAGFRVTMPGRDEP